MNDLDDIFDTDQERDTARFPGPRKPLLIASGLLLVLATIVATVTVERALAPSTGGRDAAQPGPSDSAPGSVPDSFPLRLGAEDVPVATVSVPSQPSQSSLLLFDVDVDPTKVSSPHAAMVSFRVECRSGNNPVEMQADGKVTTNIFVGQGGSISGQALTAKTDQAMECTLLAAAPFAEALEGGPTSLPLRAEFRSAPSTDIHLPALHRLDDATLFTPGTKKNVLSLQVDDPSTLDSMSSTVRLTSCTVVGGSRDGSGANKCRESMTGRESSTVRIRVIARWLDGEGNIESTTTYWDETLAIDYNTHHAPWTLRQGGLADLVPDSAAAVVLVVQVESVVGTPVVVHADGTDAVVSTQVQ